jgi:Mg-chelatase subunit ChlD
MYWDPISIPGKGEITRSFLLSLETPDFGSGLFARWDVPSFLTLDNGVLYPSSFPTTVSVINQRAVSAAATVHMLPNSIITNPGGDQSIAIAASGSGYASVPLRISEVYETVVSDMIVTMTESGQGGTDSLFVPIFIPATPLSDTGLTVTIDSVAKRASNGVSLFFEVERNSTKEMLYSLKPQNTFLYENSQRVQDFTLGKDTTGGTNAEDIVFVLDVTGSMGNQIDGVKNNIKEFADSLRARGVDYRLALVTFLDIVENVYQFTSNVDTFKNYVSEQFAHGGGDLPENSLDALYAASQLPYRSNAGRIIIWITDDQFHEKDAVTTRDRQSVINRLLELDIVVNAIGSSWYQTDWYKTITDPTGGRYYDIAGNFRDILLDIGRLQSLSRYMLTYTSPSVAGGAQTVKLEVHYGGLGGFGSIVYNRPGTVEGIGRIVCFPNPFNPQTTIRLTLPELGSARISVYSILGQRVRSFEIRPGVQSADIVWDATDERGRRVASGLYIIRSTVYSPRGDVLASGTLKALYLK